MSNVLPQVLKSYASIMGLDEAVIEEELPPHPCPYKSDLFNDNTTLCTCSAKKMRECAMDV
jgi:hypothetical protein